MATAMPNDHANPLRGLPAVHEILHAPSIAALAERQPHQAIVEAIRAELADLRRQIGAGESADGALAAEAIAQAVRGRVERASAAGFRAVINATGIVLHTNLGRAPLAETAAKAAYDAAVGYLNLELDLHSGKRSSRQEPIRAGVRRLTGAESASVVNNNAAATVITLRALAHAREVIVSRGQLIEIGGSFRIPEIMAVSGAILREVGTTNITRLADYEQAITPNTAALLRVHASNYRISGFTESVSIAELAALGKKHGLAVIDDIGSGAVLDFSRFGFEAEPIARASVAAGADLVLFSGDKLLGGPQAGIIAGGKTWIERIEKDPLMRAFRCDKMTLAALEATLRLYLDEEKALREIPVLHLLGLSMAELQARAEKLAERLRPSAGLAAVECGEDVAYVGGGSLPDQTMKTWVVAITPRDQSDADFARRLRLGTPAVLARLRGGQLVFDLRTIFPGQLDALVDAIGAAADATGPAQPAN